MAAAKKVARGSIVVENRQEIVRILHDFVVRTVQPVQVPPDFSNKLLSVASRAVHSIHSVIQSLTGCDFLAMKRVFQTMESKH
jgi:hypothetical protein